MKKLIAIATLAVIMMFAGLGTAFAANSPDSPPSPISPTISGKATGSSSTLTITPSASNPDGGPTSAVTVKVNSDGTFSTDGLTFTKPGTYTFTITDPNDPSNSYILEVVVTEDADGNLIATYSFKDKNGKTVSTLAFASSSPYVKASSGSGSSGSGSGLSSGTFGGVKTSDIPKITIGALAVIALIAGAVTSFSRRRRAQF